MKEKHKIVVFCNGNEQFTCNMPFIPKIGHKMYIYVKDKDDGTLLREVVEVKGILYEFDENNRFKHIEVECEY